MSVAQPPEDPELKKCIDKLAEFVARNGAEFERLTKEKQKGNSKFDFLYGGEHHDYYLYRVTTEQVILRHNANRGPGPRGPPPQNMLPRGPPPSGPMMGHGPPPSGPGGYPPPRFSGPPRMEYGRPPPPQMGGFPPNMPPGGGPWPGGPPPYGGGPPPSHHQPGVPPPHHHQPPIEYLRAQISLLNDQMNASQQNLDAQRNAFSEKTLKEIDSFVTRYPMEQFTILLQKTGVQHEELSRVIQPLIGSCTKDNMTLAKSWILSHMNDDDHYKLLAFYIHQRVMEEAFTFDHRLHLVYLINDVLHHCHRKSITPFRDALCAVAPAIVAKMYEGISEEQMKKVEKLLCLWEKNGYFVTDDINSMRTLESCWKYFEEQISKMCVPQLDAIKNANNAEYLQLENQNRQFLDHCIDRINQLKMQINQQQQQQPQTSQAPHPPQYSQPPPVSHFGGPGPMPPVSQFQQPPPQRFHGPPPQMDPGGPYQQPPPHHALHQPPPHHPMHHHQPPPQQPKELSQIEKVLAIGVVPKVPYHELPAGLMVPLITLDDRDYDPINPSNLRLPPPQPPTDRLLAAVEEFYRVPSSDRPRDTEGWEKLGLYEYYSAKVNVRKGQKIIIENPFSGYGADHLYGYDSGRSREQPIVDRKQPGFNRQSFSKSYGGSQRRSRSRSRSRSSSRSSSASGSFRTGSSSSRSRSRSRSPKRRGNSPRGGSSASSGRFTGLGASQTPQDEFEEFRKRRAQQYNSSLDMKHNKKKQQPADEEEEEKSEQAAHSTIS